MSGCGHNADVDGECVLCAAPASMDLYASLMRVGEPGRCEYQLPYFGDSVEPSDIVSYSRPYHVLGRDAVEDLRAMGAGGGYTICEYCDKPIFVPGDSSGGIMVEGLPKDFFKMGMIEA